jgi:hypothetical protein
MESSKGITNSGKPQFAFSGNLNTLEYFLEKQIIQKRELEFSLKDISKSELKKIEETIDVVNEGLDLVSNEN